MDDALQTIGIIYAELEVVSSALRQAFADNVFHAFLIFGMDRVEEMLVRRDYFPRLEAENTVEFVGPIHFARLQIQSPASQLGQPLCGSQGALASSQRFLRIFASGDVLNLGDEVERLTLRIPYEGNAQRSPHRMAVSAEEALLQMVRGDFLPLDSARASQTGL